MASITVSRLILSAEFFERLCLSSICLWSFFWCCLRWVRFYLFFALIIFLWLWLWFSSGFFLVRRWDAGIWYLGYTLIMGGSSFLFIKSACSFSQLVLCLFVPCTGWLCSLHFFTVLCRLFSLLLTFFLYLDCNGIFHEGFVCPVFLQSVLLLITAIVCSWMSHCSIGFDSRLQVLPFFFSGLC